jgi:diguanylate cyclase (GGDEF)-like protein/PAS domain S-box-containing protein
MSLNTLCESFIDKNERDIGLFLIDKDFNIISWNSASEYLLGYNESEVLGRSIFETIVPVHSKDGMLLDLRDKKSFDFSEVEYRTKNGRLCFLNTIVRYAQDSITFMVFSMKKERTFALKDFVNEKEIKDVVIVLDKNGYIKEFNEEASILTGYKKDEAIDRNFIEFFLPKSYEDKVLAQLQDTFRKKHLSITDNFPIKCKDGSKRVVYWKYKLYNHKHRDLRLFLTSHNQNREVANAQKLDYLASYDLLTDLPNKNLFLQKLSSSIDKVARSKDLKLMLLLLDIKNFKSVNLVLGMNYGDILLQMVAKRLNSKFRDYDTVARLDGDRFAIIVDDLENDIHSTKIINRILELFKVPFEIDGNSLNFDISIGASFYPSDANDLERLMSSADIALSKAKESKKSDFRFFMPSMYDELTKKIQMDKDLRDALKNDEFFVVYQPQVDSKTKEIIGAEALVRWEHPRLKNIPPLDFIPAAEDNNLILEIGKLVLEESIKTAKTLHDKGWSDFEMSVNISAVQLLQSDLLETVGSLLKKYDYNPNYLNLELTESVFMENLELTTKILQEFKAMGIKISIDDFGTGYSSLSYVSKLPIDVIKIDQSFVKNMKKDKNPIVDAIISMAKALELKVVAEGVEKEEQYNYLKSKNCDFIQGYYFFKPLKIDEMKKIEKKYFQNTEIA